MKSKDKIAMVSQAIGQDFHAPYVSPNAGIFGGRRQTEDTTDFACCLFVLDGKFCLKNKAFSHIPVTNRFTSEQCLGDELISYEPIKNNVKKYVGRLNAHSPEYAYGYADGIIYHAKTGSPSR
jgi:hypothetical protein